MLDVNEQLRNITFWGGYAGYVTFYQRRFETNGVVNARLCNWKLLRGQLKIERKKKLEPVSAIFETFVSRRCAIEK